MSQGTAAVMDVRTEYQHTELDRHTSNIRLVEILPGSIGSEVHCQVHIKALDREPLYTALSYTWGSPLVDAAIYIDGQRLPVRKNLWRFLQTTASKRNIGVLFWIDAICINQQDDAERAHQVSIMPRIYSSARRVDVWLGPAYHDSDLAMQAMTKDLPYWRARGRISKIWKKPVGTALRMLYERAYWTRLWVFQELMLAKEINWVCGQVELPGERFKAFMLEVQASGSNYEPEPNPTKSDAERSWEDFSEFTPLAEANMNGSRKELSLEHEHILNCPALKLVLQLGQSLSQPSLWDIMNKTYHLRCSDKRDKVYALLGVAKVGCEQIRPDYTISISNLLNDVLRAIHDVQRPTSVQGVQEQCQALADMVGIDVGSMFTIEGRPELSEMPQDVEVERYPLGLPGSAITLWWAGFHGHKAVERLLFHDTGINGNYRLVEAAESGVMAVVTRLLEAGADEGDGLSGTFSHDLDDDGSASALYMAICHDKREAVQLLIDKGADVNVQAGNYGNALQCACHIGTNEMVRLLLDKGADVNAQGGNYGSALQCACHMGTNEMVRLLLDKGADVNAQGGSYGSALQCACHMGADEMVRLLLDKGADVNAQGGNHGSALQCACHMGADEMVGLLLDKGADVNAQGGCYGSALIAASCVGQKEVVQLLLDHGADVDAKHDYYETALVAASSGGKKEVVQLLLDRGGFDEGRRDAVQLLLDQGADGNPEGGGFGNFLAALNEGRMEDY